jgi:hypothetical protein
MSGHQNRERQSASVYDRVGLFLAVASILLMMMSQMWTIAFGTVVAAFGSVVLAFGLPIPNSWARRAIAAAAVAFSAYVGGKAITKPEPVVNVAVRPCGLIAGHGVGAPGVAPVAVLRRARRGNGDRRRPDDQGGASVIQDSAYA